MHQDYFVYILASKSRELYIGVPNDLARRLAEHRAGIDPDDHAYWNDIHRLVFVEWTGGSGGDPAGEAVEGMETDEEDSS